MSLPAGKDTVSRTVIFGRDEFDLIVELACSLDEKPGSNWVQDNGGLPDYICRIARAIKRSGKSTGTAISIAVSRVKVWAAGGDDVDADTRAKAAAALAAWEALKAKAKAKGAVKKSGDRDGDRKVKATNVLMLANVEYDVEIVRAAFEAQAREARTAWRRANPNSYEDGPPYWYVRELWNTYIIVSESSDKRSKRYRVPYTVEADTNVTFGEPKEVKAQYVVVDDDDLSDITDEELQQILAATNGDTALAKIVRLHGR